MKGIFSKRLDLTGRRSGKLLVIKFIKSEKLIDGRNKVFWLCKCDCGKEILVERGNITNKHTTSCGCLRKEAMSKTGKKNKIHGLSKSRLYEVWKGMIKRCYDPKSKSYKYYGARGITVCQRWLDDFMNFYEDMEKTHRKDLSIDRINVNGNYEPNNCRWATAIEQANNKRKS